MKQEDIQRLIVIHTTAPSTTELRRKLIETFPDTIYSIFTKKGHETITTKPCEYCGNDYTMNLKNRGKYCGHECAIKASIRRQNVQCLNCNITFIKKLAEIKKAPNHFCSSSCAAAYHNRERVEAGYSTKGRTTVARCGRCAEQFDKSIHSSSDLCGACSNHDHEMRRTHDQIAPTISRAQSHVSKIWIPKSNSKCQVCGSDTGGLESMFCETCRSKQRSTNRIEAIKAGKSNVVSIKCDYIFNGKTIHCDSKLEYSCLNYFETNYQVIDIDRAQTAIAYNFESKERLFLPDFQITTTDAVFIVECKSATIGRSLNERWRLYRETAVEKKKVLFEWCAANGYTAFWYEKKLNGRFYNQLDFKSL